MVISISATCWLWGSGAGCQVGYFLSRQRALDLEQAGLVASEKPDRQRALPAGQEGKRRSNGPGIFGFHVLKIREVEPVPGRIIEQFGPLQLDRLDAPGPRQTTPPTNCLRPREVLSDVWKSAAQKVAYAFRQIVIARQVVAHELAHFFESLRAPIKFVHLAVMHLGHAQDASIGQAHARLDRVSHEEDEPSGQPQSRDHQKGWRHQRNIRFMGGRRS